MSAQEQGYPLSFRMGEIVNDQYKIVRFLGDGAYGECYKVTKKHTPEDLPLVIKIIKKGNANNPTARATLTQEWLIADGTPPHSGVVCPVALSKYNDQTFLVMPYIEGAPLNTSAYGNDLKKIMLMMQKIADALCHLGSNNIVHRDLKPENMLVDSCGNPHLIDFGCAKKIGNSEHDTDTLNVGKTTIGQTKGTPLYMGPDQAMAKPVHVGFDLYAVGVILFELVTGGTPLVYDNTYQQVMFKMMMGEGLKKLEETAKQNENVRKVQHIILKCLLAGGKPHGDTAAAYENEEGYSTAIELRADLETFISEHFGVSSDDKTGQIDISQFPEENPIVPTPASPPNVNSGTTEKTQTGISAMGDAEETDDTSVIQKIPWWALLLLLTSILLILGGLGYLVFSSDNYPATSAETDIAKDTGTTEADAPMGADASIVPDVPSDASPVAEVTDAGDTADGSSDASPAEEPDVNSALDIPDDVPPTEPDAGKPAKVKGGKGTKGPKEKKTKEEKGPKIFLPGQKPEDKKKDEGPKIFLPGKQP